MREDDTESVRDRDWAWEESIVNAVIGEVEPPYVPGVGPAWSPTCTRMHGLRCGDGPTVSPACGVHVRRAGAGWKSSQAGRLEKLKTGMSMCECAVCVHVFSCACFSFKIHLMFD